MAVALGSVHVQGTAWWKLGPELSFLVENLECRAEDFAYCHRQWKNVCWSSEGFQQSTHLPGLTIEPAEKQGEDRCRLQPEFYL